MWKVYQAAKAVDYFIGGDNCFLLLGIISVKDMEFRYSIDI
jgi:GTP cyclohydrolase III